MPVRKSSSRRAQSWIHPDALVLAHFESYPHWPALVVAINGVFRRRGGANLSGDDNANGTRNGRSAAGEDEVHVVFLAEYESAWVPVCRIVKYTEAAMHSLSKITPEHNLTPLETHLLEAAKDEAKDRHAVQPLRRPDWEPIPDVGDIVIARLDAFPPWPSEVLDAPPGNSLLVRFFADDDRQALVPVSQVVAYNTQRQRLFKVRENNPYYVDFCAAVQEADMRSANPGS